MKQPLFTPLFQRITAVYIGCMLTVYLLWPGLGGYAQFTPAKWKLFLLLTLAYTGGSLLLALELTVIGRLRPRRPAGLRGLFSVQEWLLLGFWACSALSTLCAVDRATAFWGSARCGGLVTITLCCLSALLISRLGRPRAWMLFLLGGALCLNCVLALFQFAGLNPLVLYPEGMNYYDANRLYAGEFLGTLGNADVLSAVLSATVPALWLALFRLSGKARFLLAIPLLLCLAVLAKASVAGGIVGVSGALLLTLPLLSRSRRGRLGAIAAVVLLCAGGLIFLYLYGGRLGGFLYEASEVLHGRWKDEFGSSRIFIWRHVLELVPDRLLLGGGPDTLGLRMEVGFERYDEALDMVIRSSIDDAHNEYLNILVNQGLLALICYLAMLGRAAVLWVKAAVRDPAAAICGGAVLGYCIQAFFGVTSPISAPYFWIALALLTSRLEYSVERKECLCGKSSSLP